MQKSLESDGCRAGGSAPHAAGTFASDSVNRDEHTREREEKWVGCISSKYRAEQRHSLKYFISFSSERRKRENQEGRRELHGRLRRVQREYNQKKGGGGSRKWGRGRKGPGESNSDSIFMQNKNELFLDFSRQWCVKSEQGAILLWVCCRNLSHSSFCSCSLHTLRSHVFPIHRIMSDRWTIDENSDF